MDCFVIAVHPKHARFYKRFMAFDLVGDVREYPSVQNRPAVACCLDFNRVDRERPACYDQFFGELIPPERLRPRPMTPEEIEFFSPAAEYAGCCLAIAAE
jgi:hypothetical protein